MIIQKIFLKKYNWKVVVLYNATEDDTDEIKTMLSEICDNRNTIESSVRYIKKGEYNTGFIYSIILIKLVL